MQQFRYKCRSCGVTFPAHKPVTTCTICGENWFDAKYDLKELPSNWLSQLKTRRASLWRYRELLPLQSDENIITLGEGWTPLIKAHNLGLMLGHPNIYIKDERQGPTGSFKDRQASVAVSAMKEAGISEAVVASTGNVAIAYSAYCARAGIKLWVFVTSSVPAEKMREVALYGSEVIKVAGTYDQAKRIAAEFAESKGLYLDRGIKTIATKEAMKTVAFEVAEQLGNVKAGIDSLVPNGGDRAWQAPDWYIQAISGGMGPVGVMMGFEEMQTLGFIDKIPKLACVQASGCAPMAKSFRKGLTIPENVDEPITEITTLATGVPGQAYEVLCEYIRKYGGLIDDVSDAEAFEALHKLAKMDGLSVEPATAVAFAGLFKLIRNGTIEPHEIVVVNCSGHTFPVEKHIVGEKHTRDLDGGELGDRSDGLLTALEQLDSRVQRIVIVEDNADAARLVRRILQSQGDFLIDEANNGLDGLELIKEKRPNLVITDLMMPGIDGFAIVEAMKNDPDLKQIPVIVITAKELSTFEKQKLEGKIKGLLQKGSFMDSDLLKDIRKALP